LSPSRRLRRPDSQGRQARRFTGGAADQVCADNQPQDREGARPNGADNHANDRRRGNRMKRREFITFLGGAMAAWPLTARAQQPAMPVIGYMAPYARNSDQSAANLVAFRFGLGDIGYIEGENVKIEYRFADGHYDRLPALASDLVSRQVNVLVAVGGSGLAAKAATADIPIVTMAGGDPVKAGLVLKLNRPEANLTGVALFAYSLGAKRFGLLRDAVPRTKLVAVLVNPKNPDPETHSDTNEVEAAARAVGQRILVVEASSVSEIQKAFATMVEQGVDALLVMA